MRPQIRHWLVALGLTVVPTLVAEYQKFWDDYKWRTEEKHRVIHPTRLPED